MATGKKAEYRNAIRSRKLIREAFVELTQEKELARITVTDIVTRADINRRTFYAHYVDVRALVEQIENETIAKITEFLGEGLDEGFIQNPLPLLLKVSQYMEMNVEFYRILITANDSERFLTKLKGIFVSCIKKEANIPVIIKSTPEFAVASNFIAGGIANILQVWFQGNLTQSLEELALSIAHLITMPSPINSTMLESDSELPIPGKQAKS